MVLYSFPEVGLIIPFYRRKKKKTEREEEKYTGCDLPEATQVPIG